jgi:predicted cation transporter
VAIAFDQAQILLPEFFEISRALFVLLSAGGMLIPGNISNIIPPTRCISKALSGPSSAYRRGW